MENPVGGQPAPTGSPSSDIPRLRFDDLIAAMNRGEVGPVEITFAQGEPIRIVDEFDRVGFVDSEGLVNWTEMRQSRRVCPTCGRPR